MRCMLDAAGNRRSSYREMQHITQCLQKIMSLTRETYCFNVIGNIGRPSLACTSANGQFHLFF